MAEILLSLTIIGVVAAITLPSLTGNINERTWNTQRKALYSRMSQAIALMPALNGYGVLREESSSGAGDAVDTAAETFVSAGLSKVLKINNICAENIADCGFTSKITTLQNRKINLPRTFEELNPIFVSGEHEGQTFSLPTIKSVAFETQNGESVLTFYNPTCKMEFAGWYGTWKFSQPNVCVNFVYDLNGKKGPNTVGKDIGVITVLYPADSKVVAPEPLFRNLSDGEYTQNNAIKACTTLDADSRLPNIEEVTSMFTNRYLFDYNTSSGVWSSTKIDATHGYGFGLYSGRMINSASAHTWEARCIKR